LDLLQIAAVQSQLLYVWIQGKKTLVALLPAICFVHLLLFTPIPKVVFVAAEVATMRCARPLPLILLCLGTTLALSAFVRSMVASPFTVCEMQSQ
jgi:hypothetical protein